MPPFDWGNSDSPIHTASKPMIAVLFRFLLLSTMFSYVSSMNFRYQDSIMVHLVQVMLRIMRINHTFAASNTFEACGTIDMRWIFLLIICEGLPFHLISTRSISVTQIVIQLMFEGIGGLMVLIVLLLMSCVLIVLILVFNHVTLLQIHQLGQLKLISHGKPSSHSQNHTEWHWSSNGHYHLSIKVLLLL